MKFENIQVGDEVFVPQVLEQGHRSYKLFYTPEKVVKVTNTYLVVESGRQFCIDDEKGVEGQELKSNLGLELKLNGDYLDDYGDATKVYDQSKEINQFLEKKRLIGDCNDMLVGLRVNYETQLDLSQIKEIHQIVKTLYKSIHSL